MPLLVLLFSKFMSEKLSLLKRETAHVPITCVLKNNDIMNKNMKNNKLSFKYLIGRHAIKNNKKKLINANFELNILWNFEIFIFIMSLDIWEPMTQQRHKIMDKINA